MKKLLTAAIGGALAVTGLAVWAQQPEASTTTYADPTLVALSHNPADYGQTVVATYPDGSVLVRTPGGQLALDTTGSTVYNTDDGTTPSDDTPSSTPSGGPSTNINDLISPIETQPTLPTLPTLPNLMTIMAGGEDYQLLASGVDNPTSDGDYPVTLMFNDGPGSYDVTGLWTTTDLGLLRFDHIDVTASDLPALPTGSNIDALDLLGMFGATLTDSAVGSGLHIELLGSAFDIPL